MLGSQSSPPFTHDPVFPLIAHVPAQSQGGLHEGGELTELDLERGLLKFLPLGGGQEGESFAELSDL